MTSPSISAQSGASSDKTLEVFGKTDGSHISPDEQGLKLARQENQRLSARLHMLEKAQTKLIASENILQQQATSLFQLTQSRAVSQGQIELACQELTEAISQLVQVERVSIWLTNDDETKIKCADLFQRTEQQHTNGSELEAAHYPVYFDAVMSTPLVAADDARNDPRTNEFLTGYLDVLDIYSMLDASIYVAGKVKGVICCEQVGEPRVWSSSDQNFVRSVANLVALTLETHQRQQNTQKLEQTLFQLEESQLQLIQSEKMASLGDLVAGVAHEINNPIGFLKGSVQNAEDYLRDLLGHLKLYETLYPKSVKQIQENAEEIDLDFLREDCPMLFNSMKSATERITSISNSLRTFSRADTEHKVEVDVQECLDSTLLILKYRLKANEQRPAIEISKQYDELSLVEGFSGQLNQVFMNILANAIDVFDEAAQRLSFLELQAHPQKITIQTTTSLDQNTIEIKISDNGKGMPEAVKSRIFDHLFTTKEVGKGTGLGLAIAKQIIVEKHGGSLTVHSAPGQGSQFCIGLPIQKMQSLV